MAAMKEIEKMKIELEGLKEKFAQNKGAKRVATKRAYLHLLRICGKKCGFEDPVFFDRI
ncbi:MAG: hypothetical protein NWF10_04725 [Candidatus Bathyarchaeota archaeon]|nr:hypothetical protein [Candidatus Bathyarchaeota archaeon]